MMQECQESKMLNKLKQGIMHRNLNPENVLIDENYYPKICDLGFS